MEGRLTKGGACRDLMCCSWRIGDGRDCWSRRLLLRDSFIRLRLLGEAISSYLVVSHYLMEHSSMTPGFSKTSRISKKPKQSKLQAAHALKYRPKARLLPDATAIKPSQPKTTTTSWEANQNNQNKHSQYSNSTWASCTGKDTHST